MRSEQKTFKKIKKVLDFAWNNPYSSFYRDKYKKEGINLSKDVNSMEDFKKLPFLTKKEILDVDPYDRFFMPREKLKLAHVNGGTTGGRVLAILRSGVDMPGARFHVKKALDLKIRGAMIILTETAFWAVLSRPAFKHKSIIRSLGSVFDLDRTVKIIKALKMDAIQASPSVLEAVIPYLRKEEVIDLIRYVVIAGENLSQARFEHIKKAFKNAYFTFEYGLAEATLVGHTCSHLVDNDERNLYHPISSHFYLEEINSDKETELVITHLYTKVDFPIIRYKTADVGKVIEEKCVCGANMKLKLFGRWGNNVIKVRGYSFYSEKMEKALEKAYKYLASFNCRLYIYDFKKKDILPKLILKVIPKKESTKDIKVLVARELENNFYLGEDITLGDAIKKKIFSPLKVEFVESFENTPKHKPFIYNLEN